MGLRQRARAPTRSSCRRSGSTGARSRTGAYAEFVEAGGYDDPRHWTAEGWAWRSEAGSSTRTSGGARPTAPGRVARFGRRRAARPGRAGAARLLVRGRRLRALGRQAPADRGRVGEGRRGRARRRHAPAAPGARRASAPGVANLAAAAASARRRSASYPAGESAWRLSPAARRRLGVDVLRLPAPTRASRRSPTRSTPRCSSAPSTRCSAAAPGRRTPPWSRATFRNWDLPDPPPDLRRLPLREGRVTRRATATARSTST